MSVSGIFRAYQISHIQMHVFLAFLTFTRTHARLHTCIVAAGLAAALAAQAKGLGGGVSVSGISGASDGCMTGTSGSSC